MTESMATGWYCTRSGSQMGPLTWQELYALGAAGTLSRSDLVWHEGYPQWTPAADIPGLLPAPSPRAARDRSALLPWLIPLVALVIVGGGLGTYFGLLRDNDGGARKAQAGTTTTVETTTGASFAAQPGTTGTPATGAAPATSTTVANVYYTMFEENDKYGFKDNDGTIVIAAQFDGVRYFNESLAVARQGGKAGYIDPTGAWVVRPVYEDAGDFSDGLGPVRLEGKWGLIDRTGAMVVQPQFEEVWFFREGLAKAVLNGKTGWIDHTGQWVIMPQFDEGWHFNAGRAAAETLGKWGYIDRTGKFVIQPAYDEAGDFTPEGRAEVELNGEAFYIDTEGNRVD